MKKIALLGAFDRDNYGDILFPIIIEAWFKKNNYKFSYNYYGLIESDLRSIGGKKTKSINDFYNDYNDVIIVVGGQVLNAKWSSMHLNLIDSNMMQNIYKIVYKILGSQRSNRFSQWKLKGLTMFPWIISKEVSKGAKVIYNSVGGTRFNNFSKFELATLKNDLDSSSYISVRDRVTYEKLDNMNLKNIEISPDSAIIMSELFDVKNLKQITSKRIIEIVDKYKHGNSKYICFQIGKHYGRGNEKLIAEQLIGVSKRFNMSLVLLPIGKAAGHEDHIVLSKVMKWLDGKVEVELVQERSVFDIMYLISQSNMFLGTSLHGCITSLSYNVPCISLDKRVVKAEAFLKEFFPEDQLYSVSYENIVQSVETTLGFSKEKRSLNLKKAIDLVNGNFEEIYKTIYN